MPLPKKKRCSSSSGDRGMLTEILNSVKSFDTRLRKIEEERSSSRHRSRSPRTSRGRSRSPRTSRGRSRSRRSIVSRSSYRRSHSASRSRRRTRRRIVSSSNSDGSRSRSRNRDRATEERETEPRTERSPSMGLDEPLHGEQARLEHDAQPIIVDLEQDNDAQTSRNSDFRSLLGEECVVPTLFAPPLHNDVASRWDFILRNGMDSVKRTEVVRSYAPPENCKNIVPPKLNLHVKGALSESNEKRDDRLTTLQTQVGAAVSAIGKVLSSLYQKGEEGDRENIQALSDAGRLLADLHYQETMCRRDLVLLNINKDLKETLSNSPPDEWLFGSNLEEVIKAKKTMDISSQQLKTKKVVRKASLPTTVVSKNLNYNRPFRSTRGTYRNGQQSRQVPRAKVPFKKRQDQWRSRDARQ